MDFVTLFDLTMSVNSEFHENAHGTKKHDEDDREAHGCVIQNASCVPVLIIKLRLCSLQDVGTVFSTVVQSHIETSWRGMISLLCYKLACVSSDLSVSVYVCLTSNILQSSKLRWEQAENLVSHTYKK